MSPPSGLQFRGEGVSFRVQRTGGIWFCGVLGPYGCRWVLRSVHSGMQALRLSGVARLVALSGMIGVEVMYLFSVLEHACLQLCSLGDFCVASRVPRNIYDD